MIVFFSCGQKTSIKQVVEEPQQNELEFRSGLSIDNGINRGAGFKDSLETFHNIRYIPIRIKNDSTLTLKIYLNFLKEYNHPFTDENQFNVVPMKSEWVVDGGEISDKMLLDLQEDMKNPNMTKFLEPNEEFLFGIGTVYQVAREDYIAPLPQVLFVQGEMDSIKICENRLTVEQTESDLELRIKLIFNQGNKNEHCEIISCGRISYGE